MQKFDSFWALLTTLAFMLVVPTNLIGEDLPDPCDQGCPKPNRIAITDITAETAMLSWDVADTVNAVSITVYLLIDSSVIFNTTSSAGVETITGLQACSGYGVELISDCNAEMSDPTQWIVFKADGCCRIPTGINIAAERDTVVTVAWDVVTTSSGYQVRIKPNSENDDEAWEISDAPDVIFDFADLERCTGYDVQVRTICDDGVITDWSSTILVQTSDCGHCESIDFCEARGIDATESWIDSVSFANVRNQTGINDGYFFFSAEQTALERGRSYELFVEPGYSGDACDHYVAAWFDFDQDGQFNDSTEVLINAIDSMRQGFAATLTLADTIPRGNTRMRVAIIPRVAGDTIGLPSCGIFDFGEVEDYCIRVDEPCPPPESVDTLNVGSTTATLIWDKLDNAFGYLYTNTEIGEMPGDVELTGDTSVVFGDLKKCTEYIFRLTSICQQDSNSVVFRYKTDCETSVNQLDPILASASVYPNPFSDDVTIEFTPLQDLDASLQLISFTGQVLHQEVLEARAGATVNRRFWQLNNAPAGIYLLVLRTSNGVFTRKLVKADR